MKKTLLFVLGSFFSLNVQAENIIDVYGVDYKTSESIIKKYKKDIVQLTEEFTKNLEIIQNDKNRKVLEKLSSAKKKVMERIKREQNLVYVDWNTVFYPTESNVFTTIEVVKKGDESRLKYMDVQSNIAYSKKNDLIQKMVEYDDITVSLALNHQLNKKVKCPFHHCVGGFDHPKLKPYLNIFKNGVEKDSALITNTLKNDPNPQRRAAAAFLVGCFKDPQKIMDELLPAVEDNNSFVRNNAMRVIGAAALATNIQDINVKPFIQLLDSIQETDRNKALYVLLNVSNNKKLMDKWHSTIIKDAGDKLLNILALKQPNNHEFAYMLLKKMSKKDFAAYDLPAWEKWINAEKKKIAV